MDTLHLIGRLTADPSMRYLPSGEAVVNFSMAVNRDYVSKSTDPTKPGTKVKRAVFYRLSAFGPRAETINQYLSKGDQLYVEGQLNPDWKPASDPANGMTGNGPKLWADKNGVSQASFEVTVTHFEFIGSKKDASVGASMTPDPTATPDDTSTSAIPF